MKKQHPKFNGLRIYLTSTVLYCFLVLPFVGFLALQNIRDEFADDFPYKTEINFLDSSYSKNNSILKKGIDSLVNGQIDSVFHSEIHSLLAQTDTAIGPSGVQINLEIDSVLAEVKSNGSEFPEQQVNIQNERMNKFFKLFFYFLLLSYALGFAFNLPFKIYLKRKRKQKAIGQRHGKFCKRLILYTPIINCFILFIPHLISHTYGLNSLYLSTEASPLNLERNLFNNFIYVSIASGFLTLLFVYFWQKNRVQLKYLEFFFSEEELRKRIFRSKSGKIRNQLWFASAITTFFPLAIVVLYLVLSLTSIKDLQLEELSEAQKEILLGNWSQSISAITKEGDGGLFDHYFYVNAIDSVVMFLGIGTGISVSIFYIFLIVKWTTRSIVSPVNELLGNMKKIQKNGVTDYTIVRTNDEVGELAEGFNVMIHKIRNYITSISEMNADLEIMVIERTKEIENKKEKIETQKEEIVTQLETVISQKDTIEGQQHQMLDSIHYAKRIQSAILPPEEVLSKKLSDHFILYNPRDIVSGDFYWIVSKNNKIFIAVADCTGHGVPGAFLSILGISFLNEIISKEDLQSTSEILDRLRQSLISSLHQKGKEGETQDGMEVALCCIDLETKTIQFSGANRPVYIVRKSSTVQKVVNLVDKKARIFHDGDYQLIIYQPDKMPIGVYDDTIQPFTKKDISILPGDSIYLFTDGYVDQMGGAKRKTFRVKNFRDLLLKIQEKNMTEQGKILKKKINDWQGDNDQTDDMLILGLRI